MTDKQFLQWVHDRLINVHKENYNYDFMGKLRAVINATPNEQRSYNTMSDIEQ